MYRLCLAFLILTAILAPILPAQDAPPSDGTGQVPAQGFDIRQLVMMIGSIFVIIYFLIIRPQKTQQKKHEGRLNSLKSGDKVVTIGGIYGVCSGKDDAKGKVFLDIAKGVRIEVTKNAIATILNPKGEEDGGSQTQSK